MIDRILSGLNILTAVFCGLVAGICLAEGDKNHFALMVFFAVANLWAAAL